MSDQNWNFDKVAGFVYSTKLKINIYKESTDNLEYTGLDLHRDAVSVEGEMGDEGVDVFVDVRVDTASVAFSLTCFNWHKANYGVG